MYSEHFPFKIQKQEVAAERGNTEINLNMCYVLIFKLCVLFLLNNSLVSL